MSLPPLRVRLFGAGPGLLAVTLAVVLTGATIAAGCSSGQHPATDRGPRVTATARPRRPRRRRRANRLRPTRRGPRCPGRSGRLVDPAEVGLDPEVLAELAGAAEAARSTCLVVVRDGRIAGEWYFDGATADTRGRCSRSRSRSRAPSSASPRATATSTSSSRQSTWVREWAGTPARGRHGARTCSPTTRAGSGASPSTTASCCAATTRRRWRSDLGPDPTRRAQVWAYNNAAIQTLDAGPPRGHRRRGRDLRRGPAVRPARHGRHHHGA